MTDINKIIKIIDEFTMSDEKNVKVHMNAAAGIIVKKDENGNNQVLVIQRSRDDHWPLMFEIPRGKCDKPIGENLIHCVKREVKEETGLDVNVIRLLDTFEYLADGGTRKTVCYNFLCTMKNPQQKIKLSKEHEGYKWISQVGEAELMLMPEQKKTLEMVLSKENRLVIYPDNNFTKNNQIEEYLNRIQQS